MVYMYHVSYTILLLYSVLFTSRHGPMVICHLGSSYCLHMTFLIALKAFYHNFIMLQIYNRINYRIAIIKCNLEPHYQVWRIAFIMSNTQPDKLTSSIAIYKQSNFPLLVIILIHMSINQYGKLLYAIPWHLVSGLSWMLSS